jgi:hypothetical protein
MSRPAPGPTQPAMQWVSGRETAHSAPANADVEEKWMSRGSVVVKALCYKPEGRGFDTDEAIFKFT